MKANKTTSQGHDFRCGLLPAEVCSVLKKIFYKRGIMTWKAIILFKPTLVWGAEVSHKAIGKKELSAVESSSFGGKVSLNNFAFESSDLPRPQAHVD